MKNKLIELIKQGIDYAYKKCDEIPNDRCETCDCPYWGGEDDPDYCGLLLQADYLLANGVTIQRWISVKERLPERKTIYLVHYKHAYSDVDGYWAMGTTFFDGIQFNVGYAYKVTHWMPLPEPPKEEV